MDMVTMVAYRELDEVAAPADVPDVGISAGDRGTVLLEFDRPRAAIEVEFEGEVGEPGPCVIYSPDLSEVLGHHSGYAT